MVKMSLNIHNLAEKFRNSIDPNICVRRTVEISIEEWSKPDRYIETITGIIQCQDFEETVKISAAIAMKNHIAKNWVVLFF